MFPICKKNQSCCYSISGVNLFNKFVNETQHEASSLISHKPTNESTPSAFARHRRKVILKERIATKQIIDENIIRNRESNVRFRAPSKVLYNIPLKDITSTVLNIRKQNNSTQPSQSGFPPEKKNQSIIQSLQ